MEINKIKKIIGEEGLNDSHHIDTNLIISLCCEFISLTYIVSTLYTIWIILSWYECLDKTDEFIK